MRKPTLLTRDWWAFLLKLLLCLVIWNVFFISITAAFAWQWAYPYLWPLIILTSITVIFLFLVRDTWREH